MTITTYAMESMAYLTAGTLDLHQKPDVSLEAAIVKVRRMFVNLKFSLEAVIVQVKRMFFVKVLF
jgi:hypothetical protein